MKKTAFIVIASLIAGFVVLYMVPAFRGDIEVTAGFRVGRLAVRYYGLTLALGVLAGWFISYRQAQKFLLDLRKFDNLLLVTVISGLVGARLLVVILNFEYFSRHPSEIYQIWHGGLAIYGGIAGGALGALLYAKKSKLEILKSLDALAVGIPLGQAVGRFGNFFNQEAFGPPTDLPWKMFVSPLSRPAPYLSEQFFHPTFLYESLWTLLVFVILLALAKHAPGPGVVLGGYLISYPAGRFFLEHLRLDSRVIGGLRFNQALSLFFLVCGLLLIIFFFKKRAKTL